MTKINLHGLLAEEFGHSFQMDIGRADLVFEAIDANRRGFKKRILDLHKEGFNYAMLIDKNKIESKEEVLKEEFNTKVVNIANRNNTPKTIPIGKRWINSLPDSGYRIFNIINTNKNNTATAPTYTIKNNIAKKSVFKNSNKITTLTKTKIKNNNEFIGFFALIVIIAETKIILTKKKNNN